MALKKSTLFYYSLAELPLNMALFPVLVFIPMFYASHIGVSLAAIGTVTLIARIFDIFTDPICGLMSDRTNTRWGRRRPWLVAATPILMISIYMLFMPAPGVGKFYLFTWMMMLSLGVTMLMIPYYSWAAELSPDYNERSRITGARTMMGVVASFSVQLIPIIALWGWSIGGTDQVLRLVGIGMLIAAPICVLLTVWKVPENLQPVSSQTPLLEGFRLMMANGPFKRLIVAFAVGQMALAMTTPLYMFFIAFVLGAENDAPKMLAFFYTANLLSIPFWVWLSTKIGKHRAYVCSFVLIALAHPFYLLLGMGDFWWMLPITLATGFSAGGFQALPHSMKADVIDLDTLESGENRAAMYFATYSFTAKMTMAVGASIALFGLGLVGFDASLGGQNSPDQLLGLRLLFAICPSVFYLVAGAIAWNYPITEARHAELRQALEAKTPAATGVMPNNSPA